MQWNLITVKALLSHGGLFIFCGLGGWPIREKGLFLTQDKNFIQMVLHSLCLASIEKSVLPTLKVYL